MTNITWTDDNLADLGRTFLRKVLDHMRGREDSQVRFGETGHGVMPNYQVRFPNGVVRTLRGSSHKAFEQADQFDVSKISRSFNLAEVTAAFQRATLSGSASHQSDSQLSSPPPPKVQS